MKSLAIAFVLLAFFTVQPPSGTLSMPQPNGTAVNTQTTFTINLLGTSPIGSEPSTIIFSMSPVQTSEWGTPVNVTAITTDTHCKWSIESVGAGSIIVQSGLLCRNLANRETLQFTFTILSPNSTGTSTWIAYMQNSKFVASSNQVSVQVSQG